jgi:hypothetical protein
MLQQSRQLGLLRLQVRVPSHMFLLNEDVGHGSLAGHFFQSILDRSPVVYCRESN